MKLFATLAALVSAEWNGVSSDNTCGMQIAGSSMVPTLSLVLMVSLVTPMLLFSSNKTAHPVNATTQPAGMPPSAVLTMVQPQLVFSSWKPSMTTEVPKVVMSTSKLPESVLVILSQSIWPDSLAKTSLLHSELSLPKQTHGVTNTLMMVLSPSKLVMDLSVIFSKSQSPNNQHKHQHSTCGNHQSPTKKPKALFFLKSLLI